MKYFWLCIFLTKLKLGLFQSHEKIHIESIFENEHPGWSDQIFQEIAFYLRSYKFTEPDRRLSAQSDDPTNYQHFPKPTLKELHWEVQDKCFEEFYSCFQYIHRKLRLSPFLLKDDTNYILNDMPDQDKKYVEQIDADCKNQLQKELENGSPFSDLLERYTWKTSASYYMCYYTMQKREELKHIKIPCDNFAACLDKQFGPNNKDPRANDAIEFQCAIYSFCPDPYCPEKHVKDMSECENNDKFVCGESATMDKELSSFNKDENNNFKGITLNHWNISCLCKETGFKWSSIDAMCVDINECAENTHTCVLESQNCLNLPGSFDCICNWGYDWNPDKNICYKSQPLEIYI